MSDSKQGKSQPRRSGLGTPAEAVTHLLGQSEQRQKENETDGRGRGGHAGKLGRDKTGYPKASYRVPLEIQDLVRDMAGREDVSQADIVTAAVRALHNAWQAGQIDFESLKVPARSLKSTWKLEIPGDFGSPAKS